MYIYNIFIKTTNVCMYSTLVPLLTSHFMSLLRDERILLLKNNRGQYFTNKLYHKFNSYHSNVITDTIKQYQI